MIMATVKYDSSNEFPVIHLIGDFFSNDDINELRANLKKFSQQENNLLVLDLEKANFLSSAALGVILSANAMFEKNRGKFIIAKPNDYIMNLLKITKLDIIFEIATNFHDAFESLRKLKESLQN